MKSLGQIGYEAYAQSTGGKTYDGRDMPTWEQVQERTPRVAKAWEDAASDISHTAGIRALRPSGKMNFGDALMYMREGQRVARAGWNGKGMWVALTPGSQVDTSAVPVRGALAAYAAAPGPVPVVVSVGAHIDMKAADGSLVIGWLASQTDMLAEDWTVLP